MSGSLPPESESHSNSEVPPRADSVAEAHSPVSEIHWLDGSDGEPPIEAAEPKARFDWSWLASALVGPGVIGFAVLNSTLALLFAMFALKGPAILGRPEELASWISEFSTTNLGLVILVVPGQLTFLVFAITGGFFSRESFVERLALTRGNAPLISWLIFGLGTPTVGILMTLVLNWAATIFDMQPSQQFQQIDTMLSAFTGPRLVIIIGLVAFLPGVCEELLFRGYVQSRLTKVWPPFAGVGFSSICFALAHVDPMHIFVILPVGVWLGLVAYKTGSIWPAMLGHIINNISAILLTQLTSLGVPEGQATNGALLVCVPFFIVSVGLMFGMNPKRPPTSTSP